MALTFFDAALKVLEDAKGQPLHFKDIAQRALAAGLVETAGKTPEATVGAILYTHVKKARLAGESSKVVALGRGVFALAAPSRTGLEATVDEQNRDVERRLLEYLHEMDPEAFEQLIGALLVEIGFEDVAVVGRSGDDGLDVKAELSVGGVTRVKTAIQVKRWKGSVPPKIIRELRGSLETDQRGLVITTSNFGDSASDEAAARSKVPISLIDGKKLVKLLIEHQIGVKKKEVSYYVLDLDQLEEIEETTSATPRTELALALWPVPGGTKNYVESSVAMLRYIAQASPTMDQMVTWIQQTFQDVQSGKTSKGYVRVFACLAWSNLKERTWFLRRRAGMRSVHSLTRSSRGSLSRMSPALLK